jgi:REP-associated tyrosine transposase
MWRPTYRPRALGARIDERLTQLIREVIEEKEAWPVELDVMTDHVHLLVEMDPRFGIHKLVKAIKGRTSRLLREEFSALTSKLATVWTNSSFVATMGGAPGRRLRATLRTRRTGDRRC